MTLFKVYNRKVAALPYLVRLVLKSIYEPENFSLYEEELMQRSFINWNNRLIKREEDTDVLQRLAKLIKMNEEGKLDARKAMFKEHNINYKKFHRLPEAWDIRYAPRFS